MFTWPIIDIAMINGGMVWVQRVPTLKNFSQVLPGAFGYWKLMAGAFLVVQGLRICLLVQGTQIWSLVLEDATCLRATKPLCHNYWACALEPSSHNYWALHATNTETWASGARAPQQEKSPQWEATTRSSPVHLI